MTAVIMAAIGSHVTDPGGAIGVNASWQAASLMHLVHALVLLVLSVMMQHQTRSLLFPAVLTITTGLVLFSGAIYLSQLVAWPAATRLTPFGGMLLISGWALVMFSALQSVHKK